MDEKVRIGIVGAGVLSTQMIYPAVVIVPDATLSVVCDRDEDKARRSAERFGAARVFTSVDDMLAQPDLYDAVIICINEQAYMEMSPRFMQAGKPVYIEKAPAMDAAHYLTAARVAEKTGQLFVTAFKKRYTPLYVKMKEQILGERFGRPTAMTIQRSFGGAKGLDMPGHEQPGFLRGYGIHGLDLAPWLMDSRITRLYAQSPDPMTWMIQCTFESGAVGSMLFSGHGHYNNPDDQTAVWGETDAMIFVRDFNSLTYVHDEVYHTLHQLVLGVAGGAHLGREGISESGFLPEIQAFVSAVRTGDRSGIQSDHVQTYRTMAIYDACVKSSRTDKPVTLTYEM